MRNMDTWRFAHEYCGKLWWKIGWITLIPSIIIHIPFYGTEDNTIGLVGGILVTIQVKFYEYKVELDFLEDILGVEKIKYRVNEIVDKAFV